MIRSESPLAVSAPRRRHDQKRNGFTEKSKRSATHASGSKKTSYLDIDCQNKFSKMYTKPKLSYLSLFVIHDRGPEFSFLH